MGLFEILLIAVVTLLVVGPERMPEAVRSTALTIGRVKRMLSQAKQDIEKQVGADDIRQQLHNEAVMDAIARSEAESEKNTQREFDAPLSQANNDSGMPPEDASMNESEFSIFKPPSNEKI